MSHEDQGTGYDSGAAGHEMQGRQSIPDLTSEEWIVLAKIQRDGTILDNDSLPIRTLVNKDLAGRISTAFGIRIAITSRGAEALIVQNARNSNQDFSKFIDASKPADGGPAFPGGDFKHAGTGMSLRDYFAGQIVCASSWNWAVE